ncbi:hypothetical protein ARMGADRAFT_1029753 [Armillaria gallica]|uniref:Uncharacterized protein n=1 Tax=Armillaria gallica TaxID=47427 RepID=A0A2H3DZZ9_ARMGA|nr:hypothetical protein ARMGADRAFT_1029753 [Armillaria gallica]
MCLPFPLTPPANNWPSPVRLRSDSIPCSAQKSHFFPYIVDGIHFLMMNSPPHPRRTHRKRISALRLSSDTTSTLPEYIAASNWQRPEPEPSDLPPDYPDSAEEADEDTDSDSGQDIYSTSRPTVSAATPSPSPRRKRRNPVHRRRRSSPTSTNPYLDSLLERSVHALEMSNVLLQSSISTQTSMSTILSSDSPADSTLEISARRLSSRIRNNRNIHHAWADDLEQISHGVDSLFNDTSRRNSGHSLEGSISMSLPTSSPPPEMYRHLHRRRSSTEFRTATNEPHLRLEPQVRSQLVSPPPRALTQYVVSNADDTIILPSTLGLRSTPSAYPSPTFPVPAPPPSSVRAYNMLSSLMTRPSSSGSSTPSSTFTSPSFLSRRGSSASTERGAHSRSPASRIKINQSKSPHQSKSPDSERRTLPESLSIDIRSRSQTPKFTMSPHRPMTPTIEESSPSSSSSDGCPAKQTVKCLRKILYEQPPPPPKKAPRFMPISPAPLAEAGTSTATASISRLFTKAIHSSSARPPSPPRHSALKQSSSSSTTPRTPSALSIPDMFGISISTSSSSGRSTPKRISFAELPESYAGTRPRGEGSKFADKQKRRKSKRRDRRQEEPQSWWLGWLMGGGVPSEDRMEDRMNRGWGGGRTYGSGIDDWAV